MRRLLLGLVSAASLAACSGTIDTGEVAPAAGTGGAGGVTGGAAGSGGSGASAGTNGAGGATGGATGSGGASAGTNATAGSGGGSSGGAGAPGGGAGSTGAASGAGGTSGSSAATGGTAGMELPTTLAPRIKKTGVTVPAGVKEGVQNWSIWGRRDLVISPVFTAPLASCKTLVCYTSGDEDAPTAHVVRLNADDTLDVALVTEAGFECRGLAATPTGEFGVLLWNDENDADPPVDAIELHRYSADGTAVGSTPLVNDDNHPTDFGIGESRVDYGDGRYGAYYHVHSLSGHEGDTLKYVDAASGAEDTEWDWGCSHSMSNVLRYNEGAGDFLSACVTDCYPGTDGEPFETESLGGIYAGRNDKVMDVAAGCNGDVAGELGSGAPSSTGWKLVFNAHQAPAVLGQDSYDESSMNQDIGFASVSGDGTPGDVVWLTTTAGINEMDSSIALYQPTGSAEQYLVGWVEDDGDVYRLGIVDPAGAFVEAAIDVTATVSWGRRDDPFRTHYDGDVVWAWFDQAGSTTLNVARVESGVAYTCR
jgi:hypothetical protein